uniref:Uncharacterized protein n=1 Tax=Anguilla anguilla TaxID=7936 RepID=A0A0E9T8U3_ANGAN
MRGKHSKKVPEQPGAPDQLRRWKIPVL